MQGFSIGDQDSSPKVFGLFELGLWYVTYVTLQLRKLSSLF